MADVITEDGVTLYAEWVEEKEYASQLSAPSVSIDGSRFSWQEIEGATGYEVSVNTTPEESVVTVTDTYFDFPYYYSAGDYTVRIRARGDGTSTRNSAWTSKTVCAQDPCRSDKDRDQRHHFRPDVERRYECVRLRDIR